MADTKTKKETAEKKPAKKASTKTDTKKAAKPAAKKAVKKEVSNDFAVVSIKNSQEKVRVGDVIEMMRLDGEVGDKIKFEDVLLTYNGGKTTVGTPKVEKAYVEGKIADQTKGEKIHTRIYKAKSRYRKHTGHRALVTKVEITNIKF